MCACVYVYEIIFHFVSPTHEGSPETSTSADKDTWLLAGECRYLRQSYHQEEEPGDSHIHSCGRLLSFLPW